MLTCSYYDVPKLIQVQSCQARVLHSLAIVIKDFSDTERKCQPSLPSKSMGSRVQSAWQPKWPAASRKREQTEKEGEMEWAVEKDYICWCALVHDSSGTSKEAKVLHTMTVSMPRIEGISKEKYYSEVE